MPKKPLATSPMLSTKTSSLGLKKQTSVPGKKIQTGQVDQETFPVKKEYQFIPFESDLSKAKLRDISQDEAQVFDKIPDTAEVIEGDENLLSDLDDELDCGEAELIQDEPQPLPQTHSKMVPQVLYVSPAKSPIPG